MYFTVGEGTATGVDEVGGEVIGLGLAAGFVDVAKDVVGGLDAGGDDVEEVLTADGFAGDGAVAVAVGGAVGDEDIGVGGDEVPFGTDIGATI